MPCFGPLDGWMSRERTATGKRRMSFKIRESYHDLPITVPCGKCLGCKLERARQWSLRCYHEAKMWGKNSFLTLTYSGENLPLVLGTSIPTLRPRDFVLFMKRLRRQRLERIRFLQCGEYGALGRPHHHCLLFNCDFPDKEAFKIAPSGEVIFRSRELEELWPYGFSSIGAVTVESAAYVARYTTKKISNDDVPCPKEEIEGVLTAEGAVKEYITMSRRPGIGRLWIERYWKDVYPGDRVHTIDGRSHRPPRYYDDYFKEVRPKGYARLKRRRVDSVVRDEQSSGRVIAKQIIAEANVKTRLKRSIE
ncbi:MAG: replication initiator protein [Microviridae sp.]|nr:MAG: replication initiator protein [Microviridae sp.]